MHKSRLKFSAITAFVFSLPLAAWAQSTITTIAGGGPPGQTSAVSTPIGFPWNLVQDSAGNIYISDNLSNRVFKVDVSNQLTVVAGNATNNLSGDGGPASKASLSAPEGIALDANGNVYIADAGNSNIRVVNTQTSPITVAGVTIQPGNIATVAGRGTACISPTCGDGGPATKAQLNSPAGVFVDSAGNIYIADRGDNVVRVVNAAGNISALAGTYIACTAAPCGDGAAATAAQLNSPYSVFLDKSGNIYIADTGDNAIRVVNTQASTITIAGVSVQPEFIGTVAGNYTACYTPPCGDAGAANGSGNAQLGFTFPAGLFLDASGNIYIADGGTQVSNGNVVRVVNTQATPVTFAGVTIQPNDIDRVAGSYSKGFSGDGNAATFAQMDNPSGVFVESSGNILIADQTNDAIRQVTTSGTISTTVGIGLNRAYYGDGGPATDAELFNPAGVTSDSLGNIFIADTGNNVIRKVDASSSNISTVAGNGTSCVQSPDPVCGDGASAIQAQLGDPTDVFVDAAGNIFFADTADNVIRAVNSQSTAINLAGVTIQPGDIATVAGTITAPACSVPASCGDNGPATSAQLNGPSGISLDRSGNIYIADTADNVIRVVNNQATAITLAGVTIQPMGIATVAGNYSVCTAPPCGDLGPATSAQLNNPAGVLVDTSGDIFIADGGTGANHTDNVIRVVNTQTNGITIAGVTISPGSIATVAGDAQGFTAGFSGDLGPATSARLNNPWGAFVDYLGNIFISDLGNWVIREVQDGIIDTAAGNHSAGPGFSGDNGPALQAQFSSPAGLRGDPSGNLLVADRTDWRVRRISGMVATPPTANLSALSLSFGGQAVGTASSAQSVTITNTSNLVPLPFTGISFGGANPGDFAETDNCGSSIPGNGGTCTINVTFKPAAAGSRAALMTITDGTAGNTQTIALSGTGLTSTSITLQSSANPSNLNQAVTFTATVTGSGGVPTGTVTLDDGSTALAGPVPLSDGVAKLAVSTLAAGSHSITAVYSGDANFAASTSAAVTQEVAPNFAFATPSPTSASVTAGGSVSFTISMSGQNGFNGAVSLSCTKGLPSGATCQFSPQSIMPAANSTLTITTTGPSGALALPVSKHQPSVFYGTWLLPMAVFFSAGGLVSLRRRLGQVCIVLAIAIVLVGCGGGSSNSSEGSGGTPSGSYTVIITGTAGALTQTTSVTLTVL